MIEKEKALDMAIDQIEKQFGKGAVMRLGESTTMLAVDVISTGSLSLDLALGIGGIPEGGSRRFSARSLQENRLWPITSWLRLKRRADSGIHRRGAHL